MNLTKNQVLEVEIEDVNNLGFGVAKVNGVVVFVQNGVLGDRVKIKIIKCAKTYCVARIEELLVSSPHRFEDGCRYAKRCGGCAFQHISYELEKSIKKKHVESCLAKAGVRNVPVLDVLSTGVIKGYRNKAQYPLTTVENGIAAGFFSPKTHKVCPVDHCLIQDESFSNIVNFVCKYLESNKISVYSEETGTGLVRHIYLRIAKATGQIMLCLVLREDLFPNEAKFISAVRERFPKIFGVVFNINPDNTNVILGKKNRLLFGEEKIVDVLCQNKLRFSPNSFYQVNHDGAELLYTKAFELVDLSKHDLILDLYCGIGSISLSAGKNIPIYGVEIVADAVEDAKFNAKTNGFDNADFFCGDAAKAFSIISELKSENPLLIVDPPRKGLSLELIYDIANQNINKVLYISCGPDTLARDIKLFQDLGFATKFVQPVDMFPRTTHVESVVLMSRDG